MNADGRKWSRVGKAVGWIVLVALLVSVASAAGPLPLPPLPATLGGVEKAAAVDESFPARVQRVQECMAREHVGLDGNALYDQQGRPVMRPDGRQAVAVFPTDLAAAGKGGQ